MENELKATISQKDSTVTEYKLLQEKLDHKNNDLVILKKVAEQQTNDAEEMRLFEIEVNNIRDKLLNKTREFLQFENYHKDVLTTSREKLKRCTDSNRFLTDENVNIKGILENIVQSYRDGNMLVFNNLVNKVAPDILNTNQDNLADQHDDIANNNLLGQIIRSQEMNQTDTDLTNVTDTSVSSQRAMAAKVLDEFDKILVDEFKKVERFYKKDDNRIRKTSSVPATRKSGGEKNYVEWKSKNTTDNWLENLRKKDLCEVEAENKIDLESMAKMTKNKLRESIRVQVETYQNEEILPRKIDFNKMDDRYLLPDRSYNHTRLRCTKSQSPFKDGGQKKIIKE